MRKRKLILGLAVATVLSLSIAGAAYAATGTPAQGQHRGGANVATTAGNGAANSTTASTTRDRLQDGTCDTCAATGTPATATGNQYGAPSTAGNQLQTQTRLQDGTCDGTGTCDGDGTCDGTGAQDQQQLRHGSRTR
jgi:hypothetical protein